MLHLPLLIVLRRESEEDEHDDVRSSLSAGAIAGVAVGTAVVLVVVIALCWSRWHRFRRRKIKRHGTEDEEKPLPVDTAITTSAGSEGSSIEMQTESRERQMTKSITPTPAYSKSSHNAHAGERELEHNEFTKTIHETGPSGKRAEHRLSEKEGRELELDSLEKRDSYRNFHQGQESVHEMPMNKLQPSDHTQTYYSEMDGGNYGSAEYSRLKSATISELPGSCVSGATIAGTNMTDGMGSSMSTTR